MDFYDALLPQIGAPDWHGRNLNAVDDSLVYGGINSKEPPFRFRIINASDLPSPVRGEVKGFVDMVTRARDLQDAQLDVEVEGPL